MPALRSFYTVSSSPLAWRKHTPGLVPHTTRSSDATKIRAMVVVKIKVKTMVKIKAKTMAMAGGKTLEMW